MTRKFKLAVKKFVEEDGLKIIKNSNNEKEAITNLMNECGFTKRIAKKIVRTKLYVIANIDISKL
ncbi:MAG: hypothetical protein K5892_04320 [Acholeplasmatales bacterium]|nr:hypothetical protein [Acholeplasmatales bacterium]